jgi:ribosomal protein S18 acetylase RimI-like enzyme
MKFTTHKNGSTSIFYPYKVGRFKLIDMDQPGAYLENLHIFEKRRNRGIGTKVMWEIFKMANKLGCRAISLYVACDNEGGIRFYERLGFFIALTTAAKKGAHSSHYLMVKNLIR